MADEKKIMHDLLQVAIDNDCYLKWIAAGLILGTIANPGIGTLVGFTSGLLGASLTCKPISGNLSLSQRFISEDEFKSFHEKVNAYYPVSRDEAFALAYLSLTQGKPPQTCVAPPNINARLEALFSVARA